MKVYKDFLLLIFALFFVFLHGNCYSLGNKREQTAQLLAGSDTLASVYNLTSCGLNYTSGSVLLCKRQSALPFIGVDQPASITISGIPSSAVITKAYLWFVITGQWDSTEKVTFSNPLALTDTFKGKVIGVSTDRCQDAEKATFRTDVTTAIRGNGTYYISGLPVDTAGENSDVDGATLFIIYRDSTASFTGTLVLSDGALSVRNATRTQTISGLSVASTITGKAFMLVSDLENKSGNGLKMNNGAYQGFTQKYWDFQERTTSYVAGQTSSVFGIQVPNECADMVMAGIYYQAAVTPQAPAITQKSDTLISSPAVTYQWRYNDTSIAGAEYKKYLAGRSGSYQVVSSYNGSNCYFTSAPYVLHTCIDRIKPNIKKNGRILTTDSIHYPLQWYVNEDEDSGRTAVMDTAMFTGNYWVQVHDTISGCVVNSDTVFVNLVGIKESRQNEGELELFPNPASRNFTVRLKTENADKAQVMILDIAGRTLFKDELDCHEGVNDDVLDVSAIARGTYFVKISLRNISLHGKIILTD